MAKRSPTSSLRPELVSLLHAAKQFPREDAPRLVVADWLEEHGDEQDRARATLIRLQLEYACLPSASPRYKKLVSQAQGLLRDHRAAWLGPFESFARGGWRFERGFLQLETEVHRVVGEAGEALAQGESVCWLERLEVRNGSEEGVGILLASPLFPHVTSLRIPEAKLGVAASRMLARSASLRSLVALDLDYNHVGNPGAEALAASPMLANLRYLELWINSIGTRGVQALADSPHLRQLRALNLGGNAIESSGLAALARSPVLDSVETLLVWGNRIGPDGVEALAESSHTRNVRTLYLNENRLGKRGLEALARWREFEKLEMLSLWGNALGPEGGRILADAPLGSLRVLLLSDNRLGDEGAVHLASSTNFRNLTELDLHANSITDVGVRALLGSPYLQGLTHLELRDNPISDTLLESLRKRFPHPSTA